MELVCVLFDFYTVDPDFCSGKTDNLYVIVGNCSTYYQCVQSITYIHLCPSDNIFSGLRRQCVPRYRARPQELEMCNAVLKYVLLLQICHPRLRTAQTL